MLSASASMDHPVRLSEFKQSERIETGAGLERRLLDVPGGSWRQRLTASFECRDERRNGRVRGEGEDEGKDEGWVESGLRLMEDLGRMVVKERERERRARPESCFYSLLVSRRGCACSMPKGRDPDLARDVMGKVWDPLSQGAAASAEGLAHRRGAAESAKNWWRVSADVCRSAGSSDCYVCMAKRPVKTCEVHYTTTGSGIRLERLREAGRSGVGEVDRARRERPDPAASRWRSAAWRCT